MEFIDDINGDSFGDVLVTAVNADSVGVDSGTAYIVFGKPDTSPVYLANVAKSGLGGIKIVAEAAGDALGYLGPSGDFNNDGRSDILIFTGGNDQAGINAGAVYVIFGRDPSGTNGGIWTSPASSTQTGMGRRSSPPC